MQDKRGGFLANHADKAPPWAMIWSWSDLSPPTPRRRNARRDPLGAPSRARGGRAGSSRRKINPVRTDFSALGAAAEGQPDGGVSAAFRAGAGLALLDQIIAAIRRSPARCASASPCEPRQPAPTWRASRGCFRAARRRTSLSGRRDAPTSPAGRVHRLWRLFASRPLRLDGRPCEPRLIFLDLSDAAIFEGLADALRDIVAGAEHPLAAAAGASAAAMQLFRDAPPVDAEIFALWLADLALARRFGWDAPVPLLATAIAHASSRRGPSGKRPRPADADWVDAAAGAYAMAAREAFALAGELSRRSEKLFAAQPKLRAKGAGRVVELLLRDDAISPARAAKAARLSDRAARRLFDRLIELGAVRELSGRPNFRLYGL